MITVQYYGPLRRMTGSKEEKMAVGKVTELLREIGRKYGAEAQAMAEESFILLDGKNIALIMGFKTSLQSGAVVKVLPLAGGG